jgi:tetratricopeptide (TPR) repeat protein
MQATSNQTPVYRRALVSPFLLRGSNETFLGSVVLEEFEEREGSQAMLLWHSLRCARIWTAAEPEERDRLFLPTAAKEQLTALRAQRAEIEPRLRASLRVLARLLRRKDRVTEAEVAEACIQVSEWADAAGKLATALAFMQAAALARPEDARLALRVGRLARRHAEYARTEAWFERAIRLARASHDRESYGLTLIGLGNLHLQRGNLPVARRLHGHALRAGRKYGLPGLEGMAAHDLFVIAKRAEQAEEAERLAVVALHGYGPAHPRLPNLAHDVAHWWMEQGRFAEALRVFRAVLPHVAVVHEKLLTLGNIARAAGASGDAEEFERAWKELQAGAKRSRTTQGLASALAAAAAGARSLRRDDIAFEAASRAAAVAARRQENRERFLAEAVLESLRSRTAALDESKIVPPPSSESAGLAEELVVSLKKRATALR